MSEKSSEDVAHSAEASEPSEASAVEAAPSEGVPPEAPVEHLQSQDASSEVSSSSQTELPQPSLITSVSARCASMQGKRISGLGVSLLVLVGIMFAPTAIAMMINPAGWANIGIFVGVILYVLPFAIAVCRGSANSTKVFFVNVFAGWTLVGWFLALIWAIKSPTSPDAVNKSLRLGLTLSVISALPSLIGVLLPINDPIFVAILIGLGFQQILALHWGATNFCLFQEIGTKSHLDPVIQPWDAFLVGLLSASVWPLGVLLADGALVVAAEFNIVPGQLKAHHMPMSDIAYFAAGAGALVLGLMFAYIVLVVGLNSKVVRALEANPRDTSWSRVFGRLSIGLAFGFMLAFCALQTGGSSFSWTSMGIVNGLAIAFAYWRLAALFKTQNSTVSESTVSQASAA